MPPMGGASPLRDSLRNLCADAGWSYAVFWKPIRAADAQLQLVWGDGHCKRMAGAPAISGFEAMDLLLKEKAAALRSGARGEGHVAEGAATRGESRVDTLVNKLMVHQVHVVGEGLIGHAALTGELRWILHDGLDECGSANEVSPEMKQQFWAGIQTIAVIPVLPQGVVQLGSTKMVMEDAALITYVRSLFGHLGSGAGFLPHGALVQNSILKTLIHNSLGASASISCPDAAPGSVNASAFNSDRIDHRWLGPQISATMIQSLYHPTPQLYAGATSFCGSETTQNSLNLPLNSDFFQQMVHLDCESNILLKNQLEGQQLKVQLKSDAPDVDSMKGGFSQVSSSSKESNMAILRRRESLSTEKHSCCPRGSTEITKNDNAASSCTRESQVVNKADTLTSQVYSVDCQISNAITVNRRFQAMSIADDTKHEDDSFAISDAPFVRIDQYSNHFQSPLGTLRSDSSTNTISTRQDSSHNAVDKSFCSSETGNSSKDHDLPELLKLPTSLQLSGGSDLFDILRLQQKPRGLNNSEVKDPESVFYGAEQDLKPLVGGSNDDLTGLISETDPDQLLDAIVSKMGSGCRQNLDASMTSNPSAANFDHLSLHSGSHSYTSGSSSGQLFCNLPGVSPMSVKAELPAASFGQSSSSMEKSEGCSQRQQKGYKSQISLWVENSQSIASDSISGQHKRSDEASKSNRKRPRPGENPRPRPKDRQMIQDRIKELREIVPNTAKCSIDALLEKTIKHMLFLQSVAKHADKLKEAGDRKIISQEGGLLLKDNFEGGATWAFEVGSQSMTCPIIVEDLNPPRQMLVEMLCKERGIFLEIADQIRGLGLTILKGVMEVHKDKIWARFAVEANKDVTRMEIFLALVHLLEPSAGSSVLPAGIENISLPRNSFYSSSIPATGFSNCLS